MCGGMRSCFVHDKRHMYAQLLLLINSDAQKDFRMEINNAIC